MKITQAWKRNKPSTLSGESITLTITYSSFNKEEIDELEKNMPTGILITDASLKEETHATDTDLR